MKQITRFSDRILSLCLVFLMVIGMLPVMQMNAYASNGAIPEEWYTITAYSGEYDGQAHDAVTVDIVHTEADIAVTYSTNGMSYGETVPQITNVGSLTVYVKLSADGYTEAVEEISAQVVRAKVSGFSYASTTAQVEYYAGATTYDAVLSGFDGVTYMSSDETVAKVSEAGVVTFEKTGEVTITASLAETATHNAAEASITITAVLPEIPTSWYTITEYSGKYDGQPHDAVTVDTANAEASVVVEYDGGAAVPQITTVGTLYVTVRISSDGYKTVEKRVTATVMAGERDFAFVEDAPGNLNVGDTYVRTASAPQEQETENKVVTYSSDDEEVAEVDDNGKVTAKKVGAANITATMPASDNYAKSTVSYTVNVVLADVKGFGYASTTANVLYVDGQTVTYDAALSGYAGATYKSSDTEVATVSEAGLVTFLKQGMVTITASLAETATHNAAEASITVTAEKKAGAELAFAQTALAIIYDDETPNNILSGAGTGVVYSIANETLDGETADVADIDPDTGALTVKSAGVVTVEAKIEETSDTSASNTATYTLTIDRADQTLAFAQSGLTMTYDEDVPVNTLTGAKTGVVFSIANETLDGETVDVADVDPDTGALTVKSAGVVTVRATAAQDSKYNVATATYTLTIDRADQTLSFAQSGLTMTYDEDVPVNTLTGAKTGVVFSIANETLDGETADVADVDPDTGALVVNSAGVVTVRATAAQDSKYNVATATYTLTIDRADQVVSFDVAEVDGQAYGTTLTTQILKGVEDGATVRYDVDEKDYARVNEDGEVTILRADQTIKVTATVAQTTRYNGVNASYTIKTVKAEQAALSFEQTTYNLLAGQALTVKATGGTTDAGHGNVEAVGQIKYSIESDNDDLVDSIDESSGVVTFTENKTNIKTGTITIKASRAGGTNYEDKIANAVIEVAAAETTGQYSYDGETENNSGWYTSKVTISAVVDNEETQEKNEAYRISYENVTNTSVAEWPRSITAKNEGENEYSFFLRAEDGGAVHMGQVKLKIDTNAPVINAYVGKTTLEMLLEAVTLGYYSASEVTVNIEAEDELPGSGLALLAYSVDGGNNYTEIRDSGSVSFTIDKDSRNDLVYRAEDVAGNVTEKSAGKSIIVDMTPPEIKLSYENMAEADEEYGTVYSGERTVKITIEETNFDENDVVFKVTRDGKNVTPELNWGHDNERGFHWASFRCDTDGDYEFSIEYTDLAGLEAEMVTDSFTIDQTAPEITVSYKDDVSADKTYTDTYAGNRTATVVIEERNFDSKRVNMDITSTDGVMPSVVWSHEGYIHTAEIVYSADGDYTFDISCTDMAGKTNVGVDYGNSNAPTAFTIDQTDPVIDINYDNNDADSIYTATYDAVRTATITIEEHNFDPKRVVVDIVNSDSVIPEVTWKHKDDTHTATVVFEADGDYELSVSCEDKSGRASVAEDVFTIDQTAPKISIAYEDAVSPDEVYTDTYAGVRTATITIVEHNFDVARTAVNITNTDGVIPAVSWEHKGNTHTATVVFAADGDYELTVSCEDMAGNSDYAKDTFIVDKTAPVIEIAYDSNNADRVYKTTYNAVRVATITITEHNFDADRAIVDITNTDGVIPEVVWNHNGDIHTAEIEFAADGDYGLMVSCEDMAGNVDETKDSFTIDRTAPVITASYDNNTPDGTHASVFNGTRTATVTIVEHNFDLERVDIDITNTDGVQPSISWKHSGNVHTATIAYTADGDYTFAITCEDMAGNSEGEATFAEDNVATAAFTIDRTAPVIYISYNNNSADNTYTSFYDAGRTATVTIVEHNFDADRVEAAISNSDATAPALSGWSHEGDYHYATISCTYDGDYSIRISGLDMAGNGSNVVTDSFTVDKTAPVITVSYDNNEALNENYYSETRTATITITEHNFNSGRVTVSVTATDDGEAVSAPSVSGWSSYGDRHTATVYFEGDALYTMDVSVSDKASNSSADFQQQSFYVDKTAPELTITGVEDQSANSGDVLPVITYSDTNIDLASLVITLTGANRKNVELIGFYEDIHNGQIFTFENFEEKEGVDDIYTLTATLIDMAGNESTQTIMFSVNRFGSTYALSDAAEKLNGSYIRSPVDVVITETNTDELSNIKIVIFKNGESITLVEGEDYEIDITGGNGKWYLYTYTIFKENFEDDGVYSLTVYSEDAAGNVAENTLDTKGVEISFGVDKTAPTAFVANIEDGQTYPVEVLTAFLSASDNLKLTSVEVYLDDELYTSWSEEEIAAILAGNGEFRFDILDDVNYAHKLRIVCKDAAGNETVVEISDFYVTTKWFVRYYTNEPLFYGSIIGLLLILALVIYLATRKKKESVKR